MTLICRSRDSHVVLTHTTWLVCEKLYTLSHYLSCVLVLYMSSGIYSIKSISNDRLLRSCFIAKFLPVIYWKEVVEEIFFHISFCTNCLTWGLKQGEDKVLITKWSMKIHYHRQVIRQKINEIYKWQIVTNAATHKVEHIYFFLFISSLSKILIPCSDRHFYCVNRNERYFWDQYFINNQLLHNKKANCYNIEYNFNYGTFIASIKIDSIIAINIPYKISIN